MVCLVSYDWRINTSLDWPLRALEKQKGYILTPILTEVKRRAAFFDIASKEWSTDSQQYAALARASNELLLISEWIEDNERNESRYITFHIQKSKLVTLGTCIHKFLDCPSLMRTNAQKIDVSSCSELVQLIPKCNYCFERKS